MHFINLTPHTVRVVDNNDTIVATFEPSGARASVKTSPNVVRTVDNIPMSVTAYGDVSGLPSREDGTMYIVSTMVFAHPDLQDRTDLAVPDSGPDCTRRDGQPYAVRRFTVRS